MRIHPMELEAVGEQARDPSLPDVHPERKFTSEISENRAAPFCLQLDVKGIEILHKD